MSALRELNQKPIAYYPIYRKIAGSTTGGVLLSQLMYWLAKKDKIFKTNIELMEETMLTEKELKTAKAALKNLSFLTIAIEGIPAKTYYEIDWKQYEKELNKYVQNVETCSDDSDDTVGTKGPNCVVRNGQAIKDKSFETTTENTTERKNIIKKFSFSLQRLELLENTSVEYQDKLKAYAVTKDGAFNFAAFSDHHIAKGSKFKDWSRAYNTWLLNTQKFNKLDPTQYVLKLDHPTLPNVYAEHGTNRAYDADALCFIGTFRQAARNEVREERYEEKHRPRDMSVITNLAKGMRV